MYDYNTISAHKKQSGTLAYIYYLMSIAAEGEYSAGLRVRSDRVRNCSTMWGGLLCPSCGKLERMRTFGCKDRFCPVCAARQSRVTAAQAVDVLRYILTGDQRLVLVTLTVRNMPVSGLPAAIDTITGAWHSLRRYRRISRGLVGWARNIEITKNFAENTYHPHLHALAVVDSPDLLIDGVWRAAWKRAANLDYVPISDVRTVDVAKGVSEVSKYVSKVVEILDNPLGHSFDFISDVAPIVSGRRLRSYGGEWATVRRLLKMQDPGDMSEDELAERLTESDGVLCACGSHLLASVLSWSGCRFLDVTDRVDADSRFLAYAFDALDEATKAGMSRAAEPLAEVPLTSR